MLLATIVVVSMMTIKKKVENADQNMLTTFSSCSISNHIKTDVSDEQDNDVSHENGYNADDGGFSR